MGGFRVVVEDLGQAGAAMAAAVDARAASAGSGAPGDVGNDELAGALATFSSSWARGAQALTTDTTRMGDGLRVNALSYAQVDAALSRMFGSLAGLFD
ncbi:hypothetical protein [Motilibacter aurantiacus]|uniref:hypothetical protein n=1 Tax=Motilibacter aurantiacus TaxID=2714955 RepID=UPI00140B0383|nr:hypothetical protein [Motilibacter aurantiacus]NHC44039.1 hypothetical protein [Motilibacter aurantiacus]